MIKKLLLAIFVTMSLTAIAQTGAGQWVVHPYFQGSTSSTSNCNCIDAGDKVYYLSGGSLFCFDKATETNRTLDLNSTLNDVKINQIYYNFDKGYLLVTYADCNIDIVKADGTVVNLPGIRDVVMSTTKSINDVTFAQDKAFVATSFGYITINDNNFAIGEIRDFGVNVASVAIVGDKKIMSLGGKFYYCDAESVYETLDGYKNAANSKGDGRIFPINENKFFLTCSNSFQIVTINNDSSNPELLTFALSQVVATMPSSVQATPRGFVASSFYTVNSSNVRSYQNYYYTFSPTGETPTRLIGNELYTSQEEGNNWWVMGIKGLAHIVNGVKGEYFKPSGISIAANAYWSVYDASQQRVLLNRTTDNRVLGYANSGAKPEINSYDGTQWRDITPPGVVADQGTYWLAVSPNEPDTYFYSTRLAGGVFKIQGNQMVANYTYLNSPTSDRGRSIRFDSKGNLWIAQCTDSRVATISPFDAVVITPENQLKTQVDSSMFITFDMNGLCRSSGAGDFKRMTFNIGAGDTKVFCYGSWGAPLVFWNNNDDLSVKNTKSFSSLRDQDYKEYSPKYWDYIKPDNDSILWLGSEAGVVYLDPSKAFDEDFHATRPYVTMSEGVPVSEVLLEGIQVNCIDVDSVNRKWLATNVSGVYFVSADGSEIFKHFDTTNSPLPSDQVYSVCCNRATNSVVIVTASGIVEYFVDVDPWSSDYSNVYVYPELVMPNYTGLIAIRGLMNNSNIVITDNDGNVVKTLTSVGGNVTWDGCDETGNRVKTGSYKVFASQQEPDLTAEPVTRISMIK